ncbi:MAG: serine hydrolase [Candidatus Nealsonbacteria bacterium]
MTLTNNLKFFLTALVLVSGITWGANFLGQGMEEFFLSRELISNPQILAAQANQAKFAQFMRDIRPLRDQKADDLKIEAKAAISILLNNHGGEKILFEKNSTEALPIASLSKLTTVDVILKNYDLTKEIIITKTAVAQEGNFGKLKVGQVLTVEQLLYPLLMESSNDAAFALANDYDGVDEQAFVGMMNEEAQGLDLKDTHFVNSSGLDPGTEEPKEKINVSSARDLSQLTKHLLKTPLVWEILSTQKINLYGETLISTNKLLGTIPEIIGGKTGYTDTALGCFVLVTEAPEGKGQIINVILGTPIASRFSEMEKLINWTKESYQW